jgi:hypothetical protein
MKTKTLLAATVAFVLSAGYAWADDDQHNNYTTQNVDNIGPFENIISNAPFDIEFTQRDEQKVSIYGDPAQVANVNITLMGKSLVVGCKENSDVSHVKVIVTALDLLCAIAGASGDIVVKYLDNRKFTATVSGSGDIELTGSCDQAVYNANGSGDIDGEEFRVEYLDATVNGSGSIDCRCTETLNANVVGSGEIEIHGPTRMVNRAGRKAAIRHDH